MICLIQIIFDSTSYSSIASLDGRWNSTWNYWEIIRNIFYRDDEVDNAGDYDEITAEIFKLFRK